VGTWGRTGIQMKKFKKALLGSGASPGPAEEVDIHSTARAGDLEKLRKQIAAGANVNARDEGNRTALHWAAHEGQLHCMRLLIDAGADVHATNKNNNTPLHLASSWGNTDCVKLLIQAGADLNQGGKYQNSPLHWAAVGGRMECVEVLLRAGADYSQGNQNNNRPLHWATYKGNLECVQVRYSPPKPHPQPPTATLVPESHRRWKHAGSSGGHLGGAGPIACKDQSKACTFIGHACEPVVRPLRRPFWIRSASAVVAYVRSGIYGPRVSNNSCQTATIAG
jgi:ankyrin repeat protein